jgi:hypothetical protein
MHFHDALSDRETQPSAALGLGLGRVDLLELLKDFFLIRW